MATKKKPAAKPKKTPREQLADVVKDKGSEQAVASEIPCSQQSVSAWIKGTNTPREGKQKRLKELYGIPHPW